MRIETTPLPDLKIIVPDCYQDQRGYFFESWQAKRFQDIGLDIDFVQDNLSFSTKNVLRGLHFQIRTAFSQLVTVTLGHIFDVVVDLRQHQASFGQWYARELSAKKPEQIFIPAGFAHGFCVLSEHAIVQYKCTGYYHPQDEGGIHWHSLDIPWPVKNPVISDRDACLKHLHDLPYDKLPFIKEDQHVKTT